MIKVWEVKRPDGTRYCHCGSEETAISVSNMNPGYTYDLLRFFRPNTVDVTAESVYDKTLEGQMILPESDLEIFSSK